MKKETLAAFCVISAFSAVRGQAELPAQVMPGDKPGDWVFRRISSGGLGGGRKEFRIRSDGRAEILSGTSRPSCTLPLSAVESDEIRSKILASNPGTWKLSYDLPNESKCCDRTNSEIHWVSRDEQGLVVTRTSSWTDGTSGKIPQELIEALRLAGAIDSRAEAACRKANPLPGIVRLERGLQARIKTPNMVFSAASIFLALSMTVAGARGETEAQMCRVLGQQPSTDYHDAVQKLVQSLRAGAGAAELSIANRLWIQKGYAIEPEFISITSKNYEAEAAAAEFKAAPEPSRHLINRWVEEKTKGRIRDLFPLDSIKGLTRLALANAIYFKGAWEYPFPKQATRPMPFYTGAGQKNVPMMSRLGSYGYAETRFAQIVELPYSKSALAMTIILPQERNGLAGLEKTSRGNTSTMRPAARREQVLLSMPRFKVEYEIDLQPILSGLGMAAAFSPGADFSGISSRENLFISGAFHKACVEVNEEGTEAAAATGLGIQAVSAPPPPKIVTVDHPFLFYIRDTKSGVILFSGRVSDPPE